MAVHLPACNNIASLYLKFIPSEFLAVLKFLFYINSSLLCDSCLNLRRWCVIEFHARRSLRGSLVCDSCPKGELVMYTQNKDPHHRLQALLQALLHALLSHSCMHRIAFLRAFEDYYIILLKSCCCGYHASHCTVWTPMLGEDVLKSHAALVPCRI